MSNYAISLKRSGLLLAAIAFTAVLTVVNFASIFSAKVGAAQVAARSLTLSSSLPGDATDGIPGSETNGSDATHTIAFTANVSSDTVTLTYCTTALGGCTTPTGLDLSGAVLDGASMNVTGPATPNAGVVTIDDGVDAAGATSIVLTGIKNPTVKGTFFVRIASDTDEGTVTSSITEGIAITTRVVETLGFSVTGSMAGIGDPGASCDPLTGVGAIRMGDTEDTLSITTAYDEYSAFRLYTNSANGTVVQYEGSTLTKGGDSIDAMAVKGVSTPGSEQFGLAIDQSGNSEQYASTSFGAAGQLAIESDYTDGAGLINGAADAEFMFVANTATDIARSTSYVECDTALVRYVANISPLTPAGTYTTTIVYSAVPTY